MKTNKKYFNKDLFNNCIDKKQLKKVFDDPKAKKELLNIINKIKF